ncbi:MAG TPA: LysR family transcriptional regulator [Marinagarivorans sp.]|nr:LysR family transcriptional regulator [Marinagarivorans sp.]HNG61823.1 LysR family transcriptional regulator [Cellvibrionaceae bacterium]
METLFSSLDWTLLRSFIALIDTGNLQAAARKINASQPTVGRHIALLEQQLGKRLFDRRARQLIPTEAALLIAQYARNMEANACAIDRVLKGAPVAESKNLTLTAPQGLAWGYIPIILPRLHARHPNVLFTICASNQVMNLARGEADIALRMFRPQQESLIARRVGTIKLGLFAHQRYVNKKGLPKTLSDLKNHQLISFDNKYSKNKFCELLACDERELVVRFQSDDLYVQIQMLMQGLGIMLLPEIFAAADGNLVRCLPDAPIMPMEIWLAMHEDLRTCPTTLDIYHQLADSIETYLNQNTSLYFDALFIDSLHADERSAAGHPALAEPSYC